MKRTLTFFALVAITVIALANAAGANNVTSAKVSCTSYGFTYDHFPADQEVTVHVAVTYPDGTSTASQGTTDGTDGTLSNTYLFQGKGTAHIAVTWELDGPHEYTNDFNLNCPAPPVPTTQPPAPTPTTQPPATVPTTAPPVVTTTPTPVLPGGNEGPELPKTGTEEEILIFIACFFIGFGMVTILMSRR